MTTPIRVGLRCSRFSPESLTAIPEAATPKRAARPMILRPLRCWLGIHGLISWSGTSAAILTGWPEASKVRIGPTPLVPLTQADQKASLPMPLGLTTPRPVTTTLRIDRFLRETPFVSRQHQSARISQRAICGEVESSHESDLPTAPAPRRFRAQLVRQATREGTIHFARPFHTTHLTYFWEDKSIMLCAHALRHGKNPLPNRYNQRGWNFL